MPADKYVRLDLSNGRLTQTSAADVGGPGQGGKIVALLSDGTISSTMLPNLGATIVSCIADVNLVPGDYVNVFFTSSQVRARKATSVDISANAHGYVLDTITATSSGLVYLSGLNTQIPRGSITTASHGARAFLSTTAGAITLTPPSTVGNVVQVLGIITSVDTTANLIAVHTRITDGIVV